MIANNTNEGACMLCPNGQFVDRDLHQERRCQLETTTTTVVAATEAETPMLTPSSRSGGARISVPVTLVLVLVVVVVVVVLRGRRRNREAADTAAAIAELEPGSVIEMVVNPLTLASRALTAVVNVHQEHCYVSRKSAQNESIVFRVPMDVGDATNTSETYAVYENDGLDATECELYESYAAYENDVEPENGGGSRIRNSAGAAAPVQPPASATLYCPAINAIGVNAGREAVAAYGSADGTEEVYEGPPEARGNGNSSGGGGGGGCAERTRDMEDSHRNSNA